MFGVSALPRTLEAAKRDAVHPRRHVRLAVVKDLGLLIQQSAGVDDNALSEALTVLTSMARRDAEALVRGAATVALADHPSEAVLDALLVSARDEHPYVVEMALAGLRDAAPLGHKDATRVIAKRSTDELAALRFQAVLAAGRVLDDEAFETLVLAALADGDAKVRYVACRVCEERYVGSPPARVARALEAALDDTDAFVPVAAAFVVGPLGNTKAHAVLSRAINSRLRLPAPEDEQTLVELIGELSLHDGEQGLRAHARGRFGLVPGKFAWQAQVALARLGNEWAIRRLSRDLTHRNADVRAHAATAVGAARLRGLRPTIEQLAEAGRLPSELAHSVLRELDETTA